MIHAARSPLGRRFSGSRPAGLPRMRPALCLGLTLLSGCATLPSNGPTASEVRGATRAPDNILGIRMIRIDPPLMERMLTTPAIENAAPLLTLRQAGVVDTLGPGDVLDVAIFEVGTTLFSRNGSLIAGDGGGGVPTADGQGVGGVVVDRDGAITLPYAGRIVVAGKTPAEVQALVEQRLRGLSQRPQAVVNVRQNVTNAVYVMGTVARPGRQGLTLGHETLLDAIANAGGAGLSPQDMIVRFTRGGRSVEVQLQDIRAGSPEDLTLIPGDRIEVIHQPRSFSVFGAANKIEQVPFDTRTVSLAEAVARAGGPSDASADPRAVYVFRYDPTMPPPASAAALPGAPVIYQLDLMQPASYFLAQRFMMRDKDVIFVANAAANRPTKLAGIINLLFSPFLGIRAATR